MGIKSTLTMDVSKFQFFPMNETQVTNDRIAKKLNEHHTNVGLKKYQNAWY